MDLEVLEIDFAYAIGKLERERKQTLERLVNENPLIRLLDGYYSTPNNRAALPMVFQNIALITAPNSDGQRDFTNVIEQNKYGYAFAVTPFLTQVQGDNAPQLIMEQLRLVEASKTDFDVVVIVRGGGSDIDFKSFNDYELARQIALCEKPILTGIGHDRNTSIVDLMARQLKTPTEVAAFILDNNYGFENNLLRIKARILQLAEDTIDNAKDELKHYKQRVKNLNPTTILKKGFAIVYADDKIVVDPKSITTGTEIKMHLQQEIIISTVTKKAKNEKEYDL
jgi:exodeoxyribonuclease VII large subunit